MSNLKVDKKQIKKAATALKQYIEKGDSSDLVSAIDSEDVHLQIGLQKVPHVKNKIIKINLPHRLLTETSEVCLFVKDLDKKKREHQPTIDHYEELLSNNSIEGITRIIPLKQVKLEYQPFEAKRNLSNMFDRFLVDDRIARLLPGFLGKNFYGRKRFPIQVKLTAKELKKEFEKALTQTQCIISGRGSACQVTVSHTGMKEKQIEENVKAAIERLSETIPGGPQNIKTLHIKTGNSPSLPLYIASESANDVALPARPELPPLGEPEEIDTVLGAKFRVTPGGKIQVFTDKDKKSKQDEEGSVDDEAMSDDDAEEVVDDDDDDEEEAEEEGSEAEEDSDEDCDDIPEPQTKKAKSSAPVSDKKSKASDKKSKPVQKPVASKTNRKRKAAK